MTSKKAYQCATARRAELTASLPDALWSSQETAAYLGVVQSTLWRMRRDDLAFPRGITLGKRKLSFSRRAVIAYVQAKCDAKTSG